MKSLFFVKFHLKRSPSITEGKLEAKNQKKSSTTSASQSLGPRMKRTSQVLLSPVPWHIKDDSTDASLFAAKLSKVGKAKWGGRSPHHLSIQNFTLSPTPTLYWTYLLKTFQPIQILLHKPHPWTPLPNLEVRPAHFYPNFKATTLLQSLFSSIPKCQSHFPSKALLKVVNFLIPKPPLAIGIKFLNHYKVFLWNIFQCYFLYEQKPYLAM